MSFSHQDWKQVIIRKKTSPGYQKNTLTRNSKLSNNTNSELIDDENPISKKKIDRNISKNIQSARTTQKMTRKQLAQKINIKESVIADYENGKAIPKPEILNKIEKILKTSVRK